MAYTTIKKPTDYFNTKLYTGNGSTNAITGVGFQPDLTWIKIRNAAGESHSWWDAVRTATKYISSNNNNAEATDSTGLTAFDSDGFTLGSTGRVNQNTNTFASWNWKANGAGTTNTEGSQDTTVSVNATAGFSICTFNNGSGSETFGHGLGVAPSMIIVRNIATCNWGVYHKSEGATKYLVFNDTAVTATGNTFDDTAPTSTVFSLNTAWFGAGLDGIAYCFAEKVGYSKFSSYIGNGNDDGPFVYTGFKPAFIIMKNTQQGGDDWILHNNKFPGYNVNNEYLYSNTTNAQIDASTLQLDMLSNGFKIRKSTGAFNNNGEKMVYMAFASEPLVGDNPATAR